jgi:hypothetical protein
MSLLAHRQYRSAKAKDLVATEMVVLWRWEWGISC